MEPQIQQPNQGGSTTSSLDPDAVNLAKAIRQTESGGNFNAKGKSGEFGAYQFMPGTWASASHTFLGQAVPLEQATPEQQNEVAYKQIKAWKDQGNNVGQIASMWNAGAKHKDAYLQDYSGTHINPDGSKVHYDTTKYAKSVAEAYHKIKGGGSVGADPNNPSSTANTTAQPASSGDAPSDGYSLGGFGKNVISSGAGLVGGLANMALHPVDTAKNLAGVVAGGVQDLAGGALGTGQESKTAAVGKFFKDRYGSLDKIKNTFYNDPVGAALDLSTVLTGGGAIASKLGDLGEISGLSKAGEVASSVGKAIDPVNAVTKTIGKVGNLARKTAGSAAGLTSGLGGEVNNIYDASKAGRSTTVGNLPWKPLEGGIGKQIDSLSGMSAVFHPGTIPALLPGLAASSPRVVASVAKALGMTAQKLEATLQFLEKTGISRQEALKILTQSARSTSGASPSSQ